MTTFFTTFINQKLFANQDLLHNASIGVRLLRESSKFTVADPRYTGLRTTDELLQQPGWVETTADGYPLSNTVTITRRRMPAQPATTKNNYILFTQFPLTGMAPAEVKSAAFHYVGTIDGVVNPLIMVTDTPFPLGKTVVKDGDAIVASPDASLIAPNQWLMGWPNPGAAPFLTLVEGPLTLFRGPPPFEPSHTQHVWLYPQRANMIANPSFDIQNTSYWSTNRSGTAIQQGTEWFGQFSGGSPVIVESNVFPTTGEERWTIQCKGKGNGKLKIGFVWWEGDFEETAVNWGTETFTLSPDTFTHCVVLRSAEQSYQGMVRFECDGSSLTIDEILCEKGFLKDWPYFDGASTYGARDDYSWYGGMNRQGTTYSLWYNNKRATYGRLFGRNVDDIEVVTDEEMEAQGKVFQWVPAGTVVVPHIDVLYPNDLQSPVSPKPPGVLPYRVDEATDLNGMLNPWTSLYFLEPTVGIASTPDDPSLAITGDVRFTAKVTKTNLADQDVFAAASQFGGAGERAWVQLFYTGRPWWQWSSDGSGQWNHGGATEAEVAVAFDNNVPFHFGTEFQPMQGRAQGLTLDDSGEWVPFGAVGLQPVSALPADVPAPLRIGSYQNDQQSRWDGRIYWAQMDAINQAQLVFPGVVGNHLSVPDSNVLDITDDIEIVARVTIPSALSESNCIIGKASGPIYSYALQITSWGTVSLAYGLASAPGSAEWPSAPRPAGMDPGTTVWIKATRVASTGALTFSWAADQPTEPTTWTGFGTASAPLGPMCVTTGTLNVGQWSGDALSPYNGRISRAIVRNGIGVSVPQLKFPGYRGNYLSTPHDAAQAPADIEVVARVSRSIWAAEAGVVLAKNGSYYLLVNEAILFWSGTDAGFTYPASTGHGFANGSTGWIKVTRVAATGVTSFYSAPDSPTEPTTWTARGTSTGFTGPLTIPSTLLELGAYNTVNNPLKGRILRAILRNGIGGTAVIDVDESKAVVGASTITAVTGQTLTVNQRQPAAFVFPPAGVVGNYLSVPNSAPLQITGDFTITGRITITANDPGFQCLLIKPEAIRLFVYASQLYFCWSPTGNVAEQVVTQFPLTGVTPGVPFHFGLTVDMDNGAGKAEARAWRSDDGATWTQLGTTLQTPVSSVGVTTTPVYIGAGGGTAYPYKATIFDISLRNGIGAGGTVGGTEVLRVKGSDATVGTTSFTATTGQVVTVNQSAGHTVVQRDVFTPWGPIIQGTVLDVNENNAGTMATPTTFVATSGHTVTVNQTTGNTIVQPQPDRVMWRFDATEYPGSGNTYTDPRGRVWTLSAPGAIHS